MPAAASSGPVQKRPRGRDPTCSVEANDEALQRLTHSDCPRAGSRFLTLLRYQRVMNGLASELRMSPPKISVAMSVYNNDAFVPQAIESILAQSFGDFEFLIVNDGSTDDSGNIIDSYAARDQRIRAIHQPNRGLVFSLNRMIEEARAPLIARMDGDDIALPERFERQLAFLDANEDHGVVGTWTRGIEEDGHFRPLSGPDHPTSHAEFVRALRTGPLLCHSSVIMRRDLVREADGYRPAFRHCEDYDLWLRLSERTRITNLPERLILYRRYENQVSSRHIVAQQIGAAVAWEAHCERLAGRPDPTNGLETLPPVDELDRFFGRPGISRRVRERVAREVAYSPSALVSEGYDLLLDHVKEDGGSAAGLWRTTLRLLKMGEPKRALRLAAALAAAR